MWSDCFETYGQLLLHIIRLHRMHCVRCGLLLQMEYSVIGRSVCLCVCLLVTFVSPAKTAEPILPFEGWLTRVDPRKHVLDGSPDASRKGGIFWRGFLVHRKVLGVFADGNAAKKGVILSSITARHAMRPLVCVCFVKIPRPL